MLIIGEKINGTLPKVAAAIASRDAAFVQNLARRQVEAGADYLDVNAGTAPEREPADLAWLVDTVQEAVEVPLCLDSANPAALSAALERVRQRPMVNSISGERTRLEGILPLVGRFGCAVVGLLLDEAGIPPGVEGRVAVARKIVERTREAGVRDEEVFLDPLLMAIATDTQSVVMVLEAVRRIRAEFPAVRFVVGLSNVSFGLPARGLVNRAFLVLALAAGVDAAVLDPLDRALYGTLLAAEMLLGQDRFCRNYTRAHRAGRLGA